MDLSSSSKFISDIKVNSHLTLRYVTLIMADIIVNELLCFLFNKYGKSPNDNIKVILSDFYNDEEILDAKKNAAQRTAEVKR